MRALSRGFKVLGFRVPFRGAAGFSIGRRVNREAIAARTTVAIQVRATMPCSRRHNSPNTKSVLKNEQASHSEV